MELRGNLRASRLVLALGAAAAMALGGPGMASAHDPSAGVYGCPGAADRCGYGGVTDGHLRVYSCDTKGDNIGFRTWYRLANGDTDYIDDANGSSSGCSGEFRARRTTGS